MYSLEERRDEAKKALAELRRRKTNREFTGRDAGRIINRVLIAEAIVSDYEEAIARKATQEAAGAFLQGDGAQYLLNLNRERRLFPASLIDHSDGSD